MALTFQNRKKRAKQSNIRQWKSFLTLDGHIMRKGFLIVLDTAELLQQSEY